MSELRKAMERWKPTPKKVHTVSIQGQSLVVSLEKKLEVMRHGEDAYMWKSATEIMLKPQPKLKTQYPILKKGYTCKRLFHYSEHYLMPPLQNYT